MKPYVDHLRIAIAIQIAVLAVAAATFLDRARLGRDIVPVERYYVARLLINTPSAHAENSDVETTDLSGNNPENFFDDLNSYERSEQVGEVKALTEFMRNAPWVVFHRIQLPTGGWLYYRTATDGFVQIDRVEQESGQCGSVDEKNQEVFRMRLEIQPHSSLVSGPFSIDFSDAYCRIDAATLDYRWSSGDITAVFPGEPDLGERKTTRELDADIVSRTRQWSDVRGNVDEAYATLRTRYEQQTVKLPLLDNEVTASGALAVLAALAAAVGVYMSFLLRRIAALGETTDEWVLIDPLRFFPTERSLETAVASIEVLFFGAFIVVVVGAGVAVSVAALATLGGPYTWLAWMAGVVSVTMALSMVQSLRRILRSVAAARRAD
jgi:hypothetical protein